MFQFPSNGKVYPKMCVQYFTLDEFKFQFPSNGKVYPKLDTAIEVGIDNLSFNSLQTGKCIQRMHTLQQGWSPSKFQFPSNGKVYPKQPTRSIKMNTARVSIPFKRESVSKAFTIAKKSVFISGFNSLQTGKCIQSWYFTLGCSYRQIVSIPFKRESVSKDL